MYKRKHEWRKNGIHYMQEEEIEYFDEADGSEITKEEYKSNYHKHEKTSNRYTTNESKYVGYPLIKIKIITTIVGRRKPKQLELF